MIKSYNLRKLRTLLIEEFTTEELEGFCRDTPNFKPVYDQLSQRSSTAEIVIRLLEYAERKSLIESILEWVKECKPAEYEKYQTSSQESPPPNKPASPPITNKMYNLVKIRRLFTEGFTAEQLEDLCRDTPDFKPVYHQLPQRASKVEIVQRLLMYAEGASLLEFLLDWAKERNSTEYEKYQPYYVELEEKYQPSTKEPPPTKPISPPIPDKKPWWKFW
jgi:hypothetical protein